MTTSRTVLLTGASGFIGGYVLRGLPGYALTATVRPGAAPLPVRSVAVASIGSTTDWSAALEGVDAVVHLAALAHRSARFQAENPKAYAEVNTRGTLRLAEAAARAGVRDFVFLSSIAVNGNTTDGRAPFRATDTPAPAGAYGRSKAEAEAGLAAIAARTGMAVTAIRPPLVYGSGAPGNLGRLESAVRRGLPLPLASVRNRRAFVGAENLVDFVRWRLGRESHGFEAFIVADQEQPSTPAFVTALGAALGRPARLIPFPGRLLRTALAATGRDGLAESLLASLVLDTGDAAAAGWRPRFTLAEGLSRAFGAQAPTGS